MKRKQTRGAKGATPLKPEPRPEAVVFEELRRLAQSRGFVHALSVLIFRSNVVTTTGEFTTEDFLKIYEPHNLIRTEANLLVGLMLGEHVDLAVPDARTTQEYIDRAVELLEELHHAVLAPGNQLFIEALKKRAAGVPDVASPMTSGVMLREAIFYGGESAFPFQFEALARQRYQPDRQWLLEQMGFDIDEAADVLKAVQAALQQSYATHFDIMFNQPPEQWSLLPVFTFTAEEVVEKSKLSREKVERILDAFTISENDPDLRLDAISDYNKASTHPIIRLNDGTRLAFLEYGLFQALYDNPFYWIAADKKYLAKHSQTRGSFLEQFTEQRLWDVFPGQYVYRNVIFRGPSGETLAEADAILLYGHRAFIVQAKSKRLTLASWRGDDAAIAEDFKAAVQHAYDQAVECVRHIKSGTNASVGNQSVDLTRFGPIKEFYPICMTSEHYPALAFQSRLFLKLVANPDILHPIVMDVFTLDVVAEMLATPLYFTDYLVKRAAAADRVLASHELIVLSWYLKSNLFIKEHEMFTLSDDVLVDLDLAMAVRRAGIQGLATPSGQLTRFDQTFAGRILEYVDRSSRPDVHRLGEIILGMNGETADALNEGIGRIIKLTSVDSGQHDVTVGLEGGGGITIHCNKKRHDEARRLLEHHCTMRKYVEKSDRWYGVLVDLDGDPVLMVGLEGTWKFNQGLENAAGPFRVRSRTHAIFPTQRRKIGRNEQCPCGSGLKYKKCHGR